MKPLTQEWVEKAEGDYRVASGQWQSANPVWDAICFHAEQCAEKYLKAWLVEHALDFPKTHDLEVLAGKPGSAGPGAGEAGFASNAITPLGVLLCHSASLLSKVT